MLLIDANVKPSAIHGNGLFTNEWIAKGTALWKPTSITCMHFPKEEFLNQIAKLSYYSLAEMIHYTYIKNKSIYMVTDRIRFINHSDHPNVYMDHDLVEYALCDIPAGTELLENYHQSYDANDFFHHHLDNFKNHQALFQKISDILTKNLI